MPGDERALFVLLGHLINEINILNKTFYLCSQFDDEPQWRAHAHTTQALVFAKMLVGKLYEGWELIRTGYHGTHISRRYDSKLNDDAKDSLAKLKQYFGKKNLIRDVRDRFSFHYSMEEVKTVFGLDLDEEELVMYLGENNGNTLFYFSEYVVNYALLEVVDAGNPKEAIERLIDESARVVGWLNDFSAGVLAHVADEYLLDGDRKLPMEPIDIGQVSVAEQIEMPYFFTATLEDRS
ncbi:MAG: S-adenosyl-L-homocysteine hydrolase [Gammaproteobacteria bacterium]|nr:MAG: S-adenosyl-L-homocysteine hydrolase [Gammaproteobacteria bacterium]TND04050.1 MAG: S-adenosyl-L-homocysteine hydrolase [Gammaproteobacteria bacterium]